jgi:hypothetical protein
MKRLLILLLLIPVLLPGQTTTHSDWPSVHFAITNQTNEFVITNTGEGLKFPSSVPSDSILVAQYLEFATLAKTDTALAAILNKYGTTIVDANGVQVFP